MRSGVGRVRLALLEPEDAAAPAAEQRDAEPRCKATRCHQNFPITTIEPPSAAGTGTAENRGRAIDVPSARGDG